MREIGGFIELDNYDGLMLHKDAIHLNSARNALAYVVEAKKIKRICLPYFLCDSLDDVLQKYKVSVRYYHINRDFKPIDIEIAKDEWLYIVNYYGQLSNQDISLFRDKYRNVIIDNVQAYYQQPVEGIDTIYTCRKYFGVPDGAILYTDKELDRELEYDFSYDKCEYLFGRFEKSALEFYESYTNHEATFAGQPIRKMSKLTENMLCAVPYEKVKQKRNSNFEFLHQRLASVNGLRIKSVEGPFMYPLFCENGSEIRKKLIEKKIYIPILWPNVLKVCERESVEYQMAQNILPLPVDQRYDVQDMEYIINVIKEIRME